MNFARTRGGAHPVEIERQHVQQLVHEGRVVVHRSPSDSDYHALSSGGAWVLAMRCGEWTPWWLPLHDFAWVGGVLPLPALWRQAQANSSSSSSSSGGSGGSGGGGSSSGSSSSSEDTLANELDLSTRATVVPSRGVPPDYCDIPSDDECAAVPAAEVIGGGGSPSLVYIGRLAYDKYVDELLAAYSDAVEQLKSAKHEHGAVLYLAGSGELTAHAQVLDKRYPGRLKLLGSVAPRHVSCLLRRASAYISSAPNETYGRAQVEALRCSLPLLTMSTKCNMHVREGVNGLLAADRYGLADNIVRIVREPPLLRTLTQGAVESSRAPQLADPNAKMLEAIVATHKRVLAEGRPTGKCWHALWSVLFLIGRVIDGDQATLVQLGVGLSTALLTLICLVACCCCRGGGEHASPPPKRQPSPAVTRSKRTKKE